jgi:hypothetical protein
MKVRRGTPLGNMPTPNHLEHALALWEKALGPEYPDVATSLNNLAEL